MRTVVAVDWSEQSFNAVKVVCGLFAHESLTLIHAVDLRPFENPLFAQPLGRKSAGVMREGMVAAGERLLDQTGALVPATIPSIQQVYKTSAIRQWIFDTTNGRLKWFSMLGSSWTKLRQPCEPSTRLSPRKSNMVIRLIALPKRRAMPIL